MKERRKKNKTAPFYPRVLNLKMVLGFALLLALATVFSATSAVADPGDITDNSGLIPYQQGFFAFEVESPIGSLTGDPLWNEVEQLLDNPYEFVLDPTVRGNVQGYPSYRSTQPRRRSFIYRDGTGNPCAPGSAGCVEVPHSGLLLHPLNYNPGGGEEMRLLNIDYAGGPAMVADELIHCTGPGLPVPECPSPLPDPAFTYAWTYREVIVSSGEDRIEEDEAAITFNSPIAPDTPVCIVIAEANSVANDGPVPEGSTVCGGDPGEPGYAGFGVLNVDPSGQYSTPAVPGSTKDSVIGYQLYDPVRGFIAPRDPVTGVGGLRKPSLRIPEFGGTPVVPNYAINSEANLEDDPAELAPSNENDYVRNRDMATVLGKALFWDMQVGSDSVQACASCHFNAGADSRTRNQLNPNHLGNDLDLEVFSNRAVPPADPQDNNQDVVPSDFPFHKRINPDIVGDGLNPAIVVSDSNDVMSSMGVSRFTRFDDVIVGPGAFIPGTVPPVLKPDLGTPMDDPIPVMQGLRRVEPRNTPTMIIAAMNFDNFWDGRARHDFNGGSVFGPSDPLSHVFICSNVNPSETNCQSPNQSFMATRQIIRFSSAASQATGPPLSEFEMAFFGRNWPKIGKKLLQPSDVLIDGRVVGSVTPLANQLVATDDSVLGPFSNQGGSACAALPAYDRSPGWSAIGVAGRPGLCINYPGLIRHAFFPGLWAARNRHLEGAPDASDPFDGYSLTIANGAATANDTNQFTQMEANFSLFFGLSVQIWEEILIPDDTPMDRFFDANPDTFAAFGESGEAFLALDLLNCSTTGGVQPCFVEVENFKRDPGVIARINCTLEGGTDCEEVPAGGTRVAGAVDPLLGLDFFLGSNLSLKNPNFRSMRCGECHAGGTLTDHTFGTSHQVGLIDWVQEFATGQPGVELFPEPLGRGRIITGFLLEGELQENAQDAVERNVMDLCTIGPCVDTDGNLVPTTVFEGGPQGMGLFDNGMYNIGVRPIAEDTLRGGLDIHGFPLSLAYLALKNLGGEAYSPGGDDPLTGFDQPLNPGIPLPNFDPDEDPVGGGVYETTAQDQQINPGFEEEPCPNLAEVEAGIDEECEGLLPPYLSPWASNIPVGDEIQIDEVLFGLNTLMREPMQEGFLDAFGPFNPAAVLGETFNNARQPNMAAWPNVNRVNVQGAAKPPSLRTAPLTGPFFHTGSYLTLRQVVDFYVRGGDFPITNQHHRDFLIVNLLNEDEALGGCVNSVTNRAIAPNPDGTCPEGSEPEFTPAEKEEIITSLVDFLLELVDERIAFQRAPFDQPEMFVPVDGTAPENTFGRSGFLADPRFLQVPVTGQGGLATPIQGFLGVERGDRNAPNCDSALGPISHHCREVQ